MRAVIAGCFLLLGLNWQSEAQNKTAPHQQPTAITLPAAIDHNRVIINVTLTLPDGSSQTVQAWVDNGNPDLYTSRRVASLLGLPVTCNDQECSSPPPKQIAVGEMTIPLNGIKEARIPLRPVNSAAVLALGMSAEINLPASVLRNYDVLVDFPQHHFTIGSPGTIHFRGASAKVRVAENGLIQIPSQIENKKYNLALDLGSSISFLSDELFDKLASSHPDWPHMIGAVGSANMWGADEETKWKVMRLGRVQYGPLFLTDVPVAALPKNTLDFFEKRAGMPTIGLLGANVFQ